MSDNPYQSPVDSLVDRDAEVFLSYPVDRKTLAQEADLYVTSRLEIIGAVFGLALLFVFCAIATVLQQQGSPWWVRLRDSGALVAGLGMMAVVIACVAPFVRKRMRRHVLAQTAGNALSEVGVRTLTVSVDKMSLEINGRQMQWPMKEVRYIDRKSKFRSIRHTILRLDKRLPLAIPDTADFDNVRREEFLRFLKQRCGNVCLF